MSTTKSKKYYWPLFGMLSFAACCPIVYADEPATDIRTCDVFDESSSDQSQTVSAINIQTNPIFDESDEDTIFLHRFANWLHINTQAEVIAERLPFTSGDTIAPSDIAEAERLIRGQPYIRDANVSVVPRCSPSDPLIVEVKAWDNWSMIPTVSFGRKGGQNKASIGLKEDNLLGLGIRTRFKYNSDAQRTGYQLTVESASPFIMPYSTLFFDFLDNDDGQLVHLQFDRPFYHARTETSYFVSYLKDEKTVDIYQNGATRNIFNQQSHRYEVATGWQIDSSLLHSKRIKIGLVDEEALFEDDVSRPSTGLYVPQDRSYQYIWLGFESLQRDFRVMNDIYLIQQNEDINLGLHYEVKFGLDFSSQDNHSGLGSIVSVNLSKGWEINEGLLLLAVDSQGEFNLASSDHYRVNLGAEYFKRYTPLLGLYSSIRGSTEHRPFLDFPQTVGDDTGLRGYPLQYQHGEHAVSATLEARIYSGYNVYKILDVGFAAFVDVGRAWGGEEAVLNESDQVLGSVGFGARLYSNRASHQNVIHLDIAKPLVSTDNVDSWQWRLQVKQSF
jgi:hypothetical protein